MSHLESDVEETVQHWVEAANQGTEGDSRVQVATCRKVTTEQDFEFGCDPAATDKRGTHKLPHST
jgi:hypothetical protein